jgi:hypothetical protein
MKSYVQDYDEVIWGWVTLAPGNPRSGPNCPADPENCRTNVVVWTQMFQPYLRNKQVLYCPSFNEQVLVQNASHPNCDGPDILPWFPAFWYYSHYGMAFGAIFGACTVQFPRNAFPGNSPRPLAEGGGFRPPVRTLPGVRRPAETAILQDNFTALINERAFRCPLCHWHSLWLRVRMGRRWAIQTPHGLQLHLLGRSRQINFREC